MKPEYFRSGPEGLTVSSLSHVVTKNGAAQKHTPVVDKLFALSILILVSPVLAVLWGLISLGGQRPIFLQERIGCAGDSFLIFKFRTLPDDGWDKAERAAKDSWIARFRLGLFKNISKVLRATGLDELPQFANVLKGDMQIIGPRPLVLDDFNALPEGRMERCAVPPGITGFAQINGGQDLDPTSKLALDIYVIDHVSFHMKVRIVWRTIMRIVRGTAATARANAHDLALAQKYLASRNEGRFETTAVGALEYAIARSEAPRPRMARFERGVPLLQRVHAGSAVRPHGMR